MAAETCRPHRPRSPRDARGTHCRSPVRRRYRRGRAASGNRVSQAHRPRRPPYVVRPASQPRRPTRRPRRLRAPDLPQGGHPCRSAAAGGYTSDSIQARTSEGRTPARPVQDRLTTAKDLIQPETVNPVVVRAWHHIDLPFAIARSACRNPIASPIRIPQSSTPRRAGDPADTRGASGSSALRVRAGSAVAAEPAWPLDRPVSLRAALAECRNGLNAATRRTRRRLPGSQLARHGHQPDDSRQRGSTSPRTQTGSSRPRLR